MVIERGEVTRAMQEAVDEMTENQLVALAENVQCNEDMTYITDDLLHAINIAKPGDKLFEVKCMDTWFFTAPNGEAVMEIIEKVRKDNY